jgi:hypothetical protein
MATYREYLLWWGISKNRMPTMAGIQFLKHCTIFSKKIR